MTADVRALGDRAVRFARPPGVSAQDLVAIAKTWPDVVDVVVTRSHVAIYSESADRFDLGDIAALVTSIAPTPTTATRVSREITLHAIYDGPDLAELATALRLSVADIATRHAANTYVVDTMGFAPGFAYLTGLDPRLAYPRRPTPRTRVPAGSIGIADNLTGAYPFDSPGGWNLIARLAGATVDGVEVAPALFTEAGPLLRLGDRVRFTSTAQPVAPRAIEPTRVVVPALSIVRARGLITVQDLGYRGHMHEAVPPGGALASSLLAVANGAANNSPSAPAFEICGQLRVRAERDVVLGDSLGITHQLRAGDELEVPSEPRRVAYLALRGGLDVPRGTLLCADLGRLVRAGDSFAALSLVAAAGAPSFVETNEIHVIPGPDLDAFEPAALDTLLAAPYRIRSDSNRSGTRLDGPALPRKPGLDVPRPLVAGALEVPGDGQPIVLGPELPTTGSYPVIAVVATADLDAFHALRSSSLVLFRLDTTAKFQVSSCRSRSEWSPYST